MLSRRVAIGSFVALAVSAQEASKPVQIRAEVTDSRGRNILGLDLRDFRLLENGVIQKVEALNVLPDEAGGPAYLLTYTPAANPNREFRKIEIRIVTDGERRYRVRSSAGYRPE